MDVNIRYVKFLDFIIQLYDRCIWGLYGAVVFNLLWRVVDNEVTHFKRNS